MASITFDQAGKTYPDGTVAVKDLDLHVDHGEFMILVGPSGCGKSTALRMVAGLEEITSGELRIGDEVVNDYTPKERDIAMVFQSYALYPHKTVAENLGFALKLAKVPKPEIHRRVKEAAEVLGLTDQLAKRPRALSGGQRQRVAMGRAIVRSPQAFLMDEPLSNLDAKLRVQMRAEIASLQDRLGVTTVYVTHDQIEAMTMGDRVAVLSLGVLQQVAPPAELYNEPHNLFVAGFIGSPSMNIAEVYVERVDDTWWMQLDRGANRMRVHPEAIERYPKLAGRSGSRVAVGIRPEHFCAPDEVPHDQRWPNRQVSLVEMLGAEMLVHFATDTPPVVTDAMRQAVDDDDMVERLERQAAEGSQSFVARTPPSREFKVGDVTQVGVHTERIHFFDLDTGQALR